MSPLSHNKMTKRQIKLTIAAALILTAAAVFISICIGRYPLSPSILLSGDEMALKVFFTLRLPRTIMALVCGFVLGVSGSVFQTVFQNPLASPDIIGVSSGASVGAAFAILFFSSSAAAVTASAFLGGLIAVIFSLLLSSVCGKKQLYSAVLSGIAVNSLTQALLMILKLSADPEKQLASIEYWIMGSLSATTASKLPLPLTVSLICTAVIFLLHRQITLLSIDQNEAGMLGVNVTAVRFFVLIISTLAVTSIVSVTGLISFTGLLAPHTARLITKNNRTSTMFLGGVIGSIIMLFADILARSVASSDLPVSIFTSILGAPFMVYLIVRGNRRELL